MSDSAEMRLKNTGDFLTSFEIRQAMINVSGFEDSAAQESSAEIAATPVKAFDPALSCGQVRLLADLKEIAYTLLLEKNSDGSFLTVPFSHYNFPATDEELALGCYAGAYLNVLQLWNARTLSAESLEKSWVCGELTQKACDGIRQFRDSLQKGNGVPAEFLARTGTPLEEDDEIRIQYIREEKALWDALESEKVFPFGAWDMDRLMIPPLWQRENAALAAGDEKENISVQCTIEGRCELIALEYSPEEKTLWLDVFDDTSNDNVCSLDGVEIVNADGDPLGTICNGRCTVTELENFDGSLALRLEDKTILLLNPQEL